MPASKEDYAKLVQQRIRDARLAKHLRQIDVADRMNIGEREYQRLERASSKGFNPTLETLRVLMLALELEPNDLLLEPEEI
ncbi:MAG: helix-turn-helix transcriptional regulator [Deinococcota bacterium]